MLTRITDAASTPHASLNTFTIDTSGFAEATSKAGRVAGLVILLVVVLTIGGVVAGIVAATRATKSVTESFGSATEQTAGRGFTLPPGVTLPPSATVPAAPAAPTPTGFVTPVANPKVRAPVNDVTAATNTAQAKAGRPLMLSDTHLYADGRIIFEVQTFDDPKGADNWGWKGGTVTGPEQATIGVDPSKLFPLAGLDLSNLARLCDAAIGASGIADGFIDSPYLLKIGAGLRWYIPVQSESRNSTRKTYRVAPDGTKPEVF